MVSGAVTCSYVLMLMTGEALCEQLCHLFATGGHGLGKVSG